MRRRPQQAGSSSRTPQKRSPSADGDKRIPLDVSEGDEVLYSKYGGTEVKIEGEDLLVLRESDVLALVK
jgi:co-chaperonin GroES (HSP10)